MHFTGRWRFPEVWILFVSRYDYSILSASGLSPEVQAFIRILTIRI
jgi:hypothetical protein